MRQKFHTPRPRIVPAHWVWLWLWSCVLAVAGPSTNAPAWPPPPAQPYIVYEGEITGPGDIGAKPSFFVRLANAITGVGAGATRLSRPFGLSLDEAGNVVITDTAAGAVCYLDLTHKKWLRWTAASGRKFLSPVAAVHHGRTFFAADTGLGEVLAFDEKGRLQFEITNHLARPAGLAWLDDRLLIVDSELHQVVVCGADGKFISQFGRRGTGPGEFNFPTHVAVDGRHQIYVTDSLNCRIQVFTAAGQFVREFGSPGDGPGHFSRPKGVATDPAGHVYVVDAVFDNVQIFNDSGRLLLDFGTTGSGAGEFWLPNAIAINSQNEIFVADAYNHRLQLFRYTGRE